MLAAHSTSSTSPSTPHSTSPSSNRRWNEDTNMKKQTDSTIKAHLVRGVFYLLLLVAVCAIPFALAQRNAAKRSVAKPNLSAIAQLQQTAPPLTRAISAPAATDIS